MRTILVTGGAGFIGSNFIILMLKKYNDIKIINLDKLTYAGNVQNLKSLEGHENYQFIKGDICDKECVQKIFKSSDIDCVVNFAAESHVDRSIMDPEVFIKTNVLGTSNLLNIARKFWEVGGKFVEGKRFLQVSTDEVYGSLGDTGYFREDTPFDPHSPYSASKAGADMMVKAYFDTYKMPVLITRCCNNYGPYQFPEKLIPLVINNALNKKPIPVYGDGLNVRDWIYVEDHCLGVDMVLNHGRCGEVYNIGAGCEKSNIDLVMTIINYLNANYDSSVNDLMIKYVEDRKGHDRRYGIDSTKLRKELGWVPQIGFEEGIAKTIDWYLSNLDWVKNITSGEYQEYYKKAYKE